MHSTTSAAAPLDLSTADDAVLEALHELQNRVNGERFPADLPVPYALREREWRQGGTCWVVYGRDSPLPIGNAWVGMPAEDTKQHLIEFDLLVLPEYRQQGIGRSLLAAVADVAAET